MINQNSVSSEQTAKERLRLAEQKAKLIYTRTLPGSMPSVLTNKCQIVILQNIKNLSSEVAKEVAYFIHERSEHFDAKVHDLALEIIAGLPGSEIPITTLEETRSLVGRIPQNSVIEITFKENVIPLMKALFNLRAIRFTDPRSENLVQNYVMKFNDWDDLPRNYKVSFYARPEELDSIALAFQRLLTSVRIIHSEDSLALADPSNDPKIDQADVPFNEGLYCKVLRDLGRSEEAIVWMRDLGMSSRPSDIIKSIPLPLRAHFWKIYAERSARLLSV